MGSVINGDLMKILVTGGCHRSKLNQPRMVEITQPVNLALGVLNREAFFFQTSPIATSYDGLG